MKQPIYIAILIFVFCFAVFAQANKNSCQKININAPESVQPENIFKVSASFEEENQPSTSKFNWTIIIGNDVSRINDKGIIEIDSKKPKDGETIIVLAESLDGKCQNTAMAKIFVVPPCGLANTIDEYAELSWNDEKARLDNVAYQMQNLKDMKLLAFFNFDNNTSQVERKNYLIKVLNHLSALRGLEKNRITFLVSESDSKRIWFQPFPKDFNSTFCDNCFVVRGEDLEKLNNLFQSKPAAKNRKK